LRKIHTVVAVLGIAIAGGAAWWWQQRAPSAGAPQSAGAPGTGAPGGRQAGPAGVAAGPAPVEVGRVEAARLTDDAQAVGSLRSRQGVMLRPEVAGRVAALGFQDGRNVRRGQVLLQLDDALQRAQLQQAQAQAQIARTNLQRSRELLAENFISQSAVDQNAAALQVAEAQVALAQAQLARMRVLAPFEGTAGIRAVDVGDYVKDGADLVKLEDLSSMSVDFRLPERYLARVRVGQVVEVGIDAFPGRTFAGRIDAIDVEVEADGRALLVRARVDNPGALLKPGMFARARVTFGVRDAALVVPEEALVPQGQRQFVFKVVDGADGQKVSQRVEARVGLRLPGKVEILEGLAAGDTVVTAGQSRLLRGDAVPVRVVDVGASRPAASAASATAGAKGGKSAPAP
jgi:membrane fusion protein (multidrug efflux system)